MDDSTVSIEAETLDLSLFSVVRDELVQLRETGHDVDDQETALTSIHPDDIEALESLLASMAGVPRAVGWAYEEPDDWDSIRDLLSTGPSSTRPGGIDDRQLDDKILGGWYGRIAGCNLGKPIENGPYWTTDRIRRYLELVDAWPLRAYIPAMDPMPDGFHFQPCWVDTTQGRIDGSDRDDDIDYSILGLHLLERHGRAFTTSDVADAWLDLLPYQRVYTAERAAYKNLVAGVAVSEAATLKNPYREWVGALIRADAFGWVSPGAPAAAAELAYRDAALSHTGNGIYGEMWSAALIALAFGAASAREAVEQSLGYLPPRSRLAEALRHVCDLHAQGKSWDDGIAEIQRVYGNYHWVHVIGNACVIAAGLLWGEDDYAATVGLTVSGGWDTDSNGAAAGSVSGVLHGYRGLPADFVGPLGDKTRSALFGFDYSSISNLANRTIKLARSGLPQASM